jgi:hypothetical protein
VKRGADDDIACTQVERIRRRNFAKRAADAPFWTIDREGSRETRELASIPRLPLDDVGREAAARHIAAGNTRRAHCDFAR